MTQLVLGGNLSMIHRVLFEKRVFQKFQNYKECAVGWQKLRSLTFLRLTKENAY